MFVLRKCTFGQVKELLGARWAVRGKLRKLGSVCKGQGPWRREVITVLIFGTLGRAHGKARLSELPWKMPGGVGNPV